MKSDTKPAKAPKYEHSVPFFWPLAMIAEMDEEGLEIFKRNLDFVGVVEKE